MLGTKKGAEAKLNLSSVWLFRVVENKIIKPNKYLTIPQFMYYWICSKKNEIFFQIISVEYQFIRF